MIRLARSGRVIELAEQQRWLQGLAGRFVSGPTVNDAVRCALDLGRAGISTSMFTWVST